MIWNSSNMSLEILRVHYPTLNMKFSVFPRYQTENSFCYMKYVIVFISLLKIWVETLQQDRWKLWNSCIKRWVLENITWLMEHTLFHLKNIRHVFSSMKYVILKVAKSQLCKTPYYPEMLPHTTQKARLKHKPNHPQIGCLKSN